MNKVRFFTYVMAIGVIGIFIHPIMLVVAIFGLVGMHVESEIDDEQE